MEKGIPVKISVVTVKRQLVTTFGVFVALFYLSYIKKAMSDYQLFKQYTMIGTWSNSTDNRGFTYILASSPKSTKELRINRNGKSVTQNIEPGKVLVVVFDGVQGKAKVTEAAEHGLTIRETAKGKVAKIKYDEGELF